MQRASNIELLRIVAMIFVLLLHANYLSLGEVDIKSLQTSPINSIARAYAEQLCVICVNLFVLISGYFGIRPNVKGVFSLLYQVFYYHILISVLLLCLGISITLKDFIKVFCFGIPYWFVASYLVLYALSSVLNSFIKMASPQLFISVIIFFFILEFSVGWCTNYAGFNYGYSAISFIGLYLLAGFVRLYSKKLVNINIFIGLFMYLLLSLIPVLLFYMTGHKWGIISYTSPFVIAASLYFFLSFNRMKFSNKIINYIASSIFSVYLVHLHPFICDYYIYIMKYMYNILNVYEYVMFLFVFVLLFILVCVMLDKIRIITWKFLFNKVFNIIILNLESVPNKILSKI